VSDYILWYGRARKSLKFRQPYEIKALSDFAYEYKYSQDKAGYRALDQRAGLEGGRIFAIKPLTSQTNASTTVYDYVFRGVSFKSGKRQWATPVSGMNRLVLANRVERRASSIGFVRFFEDFPVVPRTNIWTDTGTGSFTDEKVYVVQSSAKAIERCILMASDPGDLVLDPTCGSGTTATAAEQWGRRWITIDTSRVALALTRTRLMAAKYPYYLLADSPEGRAQEQKISGRIQPETSTCNDVRHGFVYERVAHITLKSIANNSDIDVLWEEAQVTLEPLRTRLNNALGTSWEEWQVPREVDSVWPPSAVADHATWWAARIERQRRIDASIARRADIEFLYDRPHVDTQRVRVAGPFTVESLSPHRMVPSDEDDLLDRPNTSKPEAGRRPRAAAPPVDFAEMVLENLRTTGVHQSQRADSIHFTSLVPWPGTYIAADGRYTEADSERRAGILIGPEFGTLSRTDLVTAAREASEARFDVLIACAFNFDAHASELTKLGPMPILKARMNPDLHMAEDLKNTGKGNLFVVFGEPDVVVEPVEGAPDAVRICILGVDVFDPQTGDIRSGDTKSIAAWFIDTDYNEESFYVRHAYFLGANDPYKSLKAALRADIDEEAWATLYRDVSRPFPRPETGRIAVKVINHFGDEVMKVFTI
jgi:adenine-specific DNA-methyltransferase